MSQRLVDAVYRSPAPDYLKRGVLGALAAWARDDGTFPSPPTVLALTEHRYFDGRRDERTIQRHLRALERLDLISAPPHVGGRDIPRRYVLHLSAILGLTDAAVDADAAHRAARRSARKGETVSPFAEPGNDARKGDTKGDTEARKGDTKGDTAADPLYVREKRKNVRTDTEEPRRVPSPSKGDEQVTTDERLDARGQLAKVFRAALDPAALAAAQQRTNTRRIAKALRGLVEARPRPAWLDYGDVRDGLRRELKRLHLDYTPAEFDDAISWLGTNAHLVSAPPPPTAPEAAHP